MRRSAGALLAAIVVALVVPAAASPATAQEAVPVERGAWLDVVSQNAWVEPEGSYLLTLDARDAPEGSTIETTFYDDPITTRADFNYTVLGVGLGDADAANRIPPIDVDEDMTSVGRERRRGNIGISLVNQGAERAGFITFERGLRGAGAYPIDIRLVGPNGDQLDRIITYLVRLPEDMDGVQPLRAAMLFELHAPPAHGPGGEAQVSSDAVEQMAQVAVGMEGDDDAPVTLAPTPETIEALAREPGRAREVLWRFQERTDQAQTIDSTYVRVPVSSWVAAGMRDELNNQRIRGNAVLSEQLEEPDRSTWLATPDLTAEAAAELWEGGVTRFVLPESSVGGPGTEQGGTVSARPFQLATRIDAPVQAVAVDSSLSYALGNPNIGDTQLQAQQLVAQLSVLQGEDPTQARGVVFGPGADPVSGKVVREVLRLLQGNPLVRPATVGDVFDQVQPASDPAGAPVVRDLQPAAAPDLDGYPAQLAGLRATVGSFGQLVPGATALVDAFDQRLLESGSVDLSPAERTRHLAVIQATIDRRLDRIDSPETQTVTLTSREGVIPFTLRNELARPVDLVLELQGGSAIEFPGGEDRLTERVEPGSRQIRLRVHTRSPGVIPITVRVTSPDGGLLVTTSRVTVRSTAVSGIGYVLTIGAAGFLVVWWFRHWRRTRRERRLATGT